MNKKILKKVFTFLLTVCILISCTSMDTVLAAANRALSVSYSFKKLTWQKDGDKCAQNTYSIVLPGKTKKTALKDLKMGGVVYIPKKAIKRNESCVNLSFYLDIFNSNEKYIGDVRPRIVITLVNENGKAKLYAWDEVKEKNVKASSYASFKAGKGKYKDYYIVTLKNNPLIQEIVLDGSEKRQKITSKTKYAFNAGICITGEGYKTSGTLYLDELSVTSSGKKILNHTFAKKPAWYCVFNQDKELSKKKVKIVNF